MMAKNWAELTWASADVAEVTINGLACDRSDLSQKVTIWNPNRADWANRNGAVIFFNEFAFSFMSVVAMWRSNLGDE